MSTRPPALDLLPQYLAEGVPKQDDLGLHALQDWINALFKYRQDVADADTDHGAVLTEWQTARRNLALAQAALAIGEASDSGHLVGTDLGDGESDSSVVI